MGIYAICQVCGSGRDVWNACPVCTETGEYIDPRELQGSVFDDLKVIEGSTDSTGGVPYIPNG